MKKRKRIGLIVLVSILCFSSGIFFVRFRPQAKEDVFTNLRLFSQVLNLLNVQYVEEIDSQHLIYGAIKGMLATLDDPYTHFLEPQEYSNLQVETRGAFGGLGIEIDLEPLSKWLMVVAPIEGTPAYREGLKAGDKIIEIEGNSTKGITLSEAVSKLRGQPGTKVAITVQREELKEALYFTITREIIKLKAVRFSHILEDNVGYLRLATFNENVDKELQEVLVDLEKRGINSLILDMRNNPGGLLDQAVKVANEFLSEGVIVSTRGRMLGEEIKYLAREKGTHPPYPLILLVNKGSASAAEIVAGAIRDNKRGLIVGTKTFGKGSVQTVTKLEGGAGIAITSAYYYTPSGVCIHKEGIVPDIDIEGEISLIEKETSQLLYVLKRNNCFIALAKRLSFKGDWNKFVLGEKESNLLKEILREKNIEYKEEELNRARSYLEKEIKIEIASLEDEKQGLRAQIILDPAVKKAMDILKAANLLKGRG